MSLSSIKTMWLAAGAATPVLARLVSLAFPESQNMICAAGILLGSLVLWMSDALPISISTLLMICLLPFTGLMPFTSAISNFGINTSLFIMASSGITVALSSSGIPDKVTSVILRRLNGRPGLILFSLGIAVTLFSAFMSSLAACALFTGLLLSVMEKSDIRPGRSVFGKDAMLIIPACAGIGGFMTPAGTPANILIVELLQKQGHSVSFLQWSMVGFPVGMTAAILFLVSVLLLHRPEKVSFVSADEAKPFSRRDRLIMVILLAVIFCWFLGSVYAPLNTTLVALMGLIVMLVPSLHIIDFKQFSRGVNWDLVLTMGSVSILMAAVSDTGLVSMIASAFIRAILGCSPFLSMVLISLIICLLRAFIPTTTAVIALFAPMLASIAGYNGLDIVVLFFLLAFWAATALLLVFTEPIFLISYKTGYYRQSDLLAAGTMPCLILSALISFLIPFLVHEAGII